MTERHPQLPSLTAGRGLAALIVAAYHASFLWETRLSPVTSFGWLGVTFFYILSGFVLTWSFSDKRSYKEFIVHRIARIFPVHLFCLFVAIAAYARFHAPFGGYIGTPIGTVLQLFLVHDFVPGHPNIRQAWNGVSWSLSVEFFFYLFAPTIIRRMKKLRSHALINIGIFLYVAHSSVGIMAFKMHYVKISDFMVYHPISFLPVFAYGIIGAILLQRGLRVRVHFLVKLALFIPVIVYCFDIPDRDAIAMMDLTIPAFISLILDWACSDMKGTRSLLAGRFFGKIGEISFSLYMTHALLLAFAGLILSRWNVPNHPTLFLIVFLLVSLPVAYLVYTWIEMPMKNYLIRRFVPSIKVKAVPAVPLQ